MIYLVIGPNGSGKSEYSEQLAVSIGKGQLLYIATLVPTSDACHRRIEKHRSMRDGKGFETFETPGPLNDILVNSGSTVLLEDVSNLLANSMFSGDCGGNAERARTDIAALAGRCTNLICVSIGGLQPCSDFDKGTNLYIRQLNMLNAMLWDLADEVVELDKGNVSLQKGSIA